MKIKLVFTVFLASLLFFGCSDNGNDIGDEDSSNIICKNGGKAINGSCDCPEGYGGSDCSEKLFPSQVTVKEIIITKFPQNTKEGDSWDELGKPDIAVAIYDGSAQLFFSQIKQEVNYSDTNVFSCDYVFMNSNVLRSYDIPLTEWDGDEYQLVGIMGFTPYNGGSATLDTVAIATTDSAKSIQGNLILEYKSD